LVAALVIGEAERDRLTHLRLRALTHPVDMLALVDAIKTPKGKAAHMRRMKLQTVALPFGFLVTFSIEDNHPCGTCRHMSMSGARAPRVPSPHAVWMVAELLGFVDSLAACTHWLEDLEGHGQAVNVVQPISPFAPGGHA